MNDVTKELEATVYLQPANKIIIVSTNFAVNDYTINAMIGKLPLMIKNVRGLSLFTIDVTTLKSGIHVLTLTGIQNEKHEVFFAKS